MKDPFLFVKKKTGLLFSLLLFLCSCSSSDNPFPSGLQQHTGEYLYRIHDEYLFKVPPPEPVAPIPYVWETNLIGGCPKITKEYFRCKGSSLNPVRLVQKVKQVDHYIDCGGGHSLPLKDNKEFVYPILIDLLNHIQARTNCKVVITCGHCCPDHQAYSDPSPQNQYSKHMIGAEVAFYVQGMENSPEKISQLIQNYYKTEPKYENHSDYVQFKPYEKNDANTSITPIYNKEIFLKIYKENEGRNFDNRHPYPYIAIQVRYDFEAKERVVYAWNLAHRNYLR